MQSIKEALVSTAIGAALVLAAARLGLPWLWIPVIVAFRSGWAWGFGRRQELMVGLAVAFAIAVGIVLTLYVPASALPILLGAVVSLLLTAAGWLLGMAAHAFIRTVRRLAFRYRPGA